MSTPLLVGRAAPPIRRRGSGRQRGAVLAVAAAMLAFAPALTAQAADHGRSPRGIVPPARPAANVPARPAFLGVCSAAAVQATLCARTTLRALDHARSLEGLPPLVLPVRYAGLTPAEQLFVLVDEERSSRGLAPFLGLVPALDRLATVAVHAGTDPALTGWRLGADRVGAWAGNWAEGAGPLGATYGWMYDDGYGSGNLACPTPAARACWGHRDNILVRWTPGPGRWMVMGAASALGGGAGQQAATEVMALVQGPRPSLAFSWAEAAAEGF